MKTLNNSFDLAHFAWILLSMLLLSSFSANHFRSEHKVPLITDNSDTINFSDLAAELKTKEVISMGEAVHFSKTLYAYQFKLYKALNDSMQIGKVFIENSYFMLGELIHSLSFREEGYAEQRSLVKTMHRSGSKVYGINPGYLSQNVYMFYSALRNKNSKLAEQFHSLFGLDSFKENYFWYKINKEELELFKSRLDSFDAPVKSLSYFAYPDAVYFLKKDLEYVYLKRTQGDKIRDSLMVQIIADFKQKGEKIFVIAHNAHLSAGKSYGHNLGHFLRARYKNDYFSIGSDFYKGSYWAYYRDGKIMSDDILLNSTDGKYADYWNKNKDLIKSAPFFMRSSSIPDKSYRTKWVGSYDYKGKHSIVNYHRDFDALIFFPLIEACK